MEGGMRIPVHKMGSRWGLFSSLVRFSYTSISSVSGFMFTGNLLTVVYGSKYYSLYSYFW